MAAHDRSPVRERLEQARLLADLKQEQVDAIVYPDRADGPTHSWLSKIESGETRRVEPELLGQLIEIYRTHAQEPITADWVLTGKMGAPTGAYVQQLTELMESVGPTTQRQIARAVRAIAEESPEYRAAAPTTPEEAPASPRSRPASRGRVDEADDREPHAHGPREQSA